MPTPSPTIAECKNDVLDAGVGETDVDCGGDFCPPCALNEVCSVDSDCFTGGSCDSSSLVCVYAPTALPIPAPTALPVPAPTPVSDEPSATPVPAPTAGPGSPSATPVPAPTAPPKKKSEDDDSAALGLGLGLGLGIPFLLIVAYGVYFQSERNKSEPPPPGPTPTYSDPMVANPGAVELGVGGGYSEDEPNNELASHMVAGGRWLEA